MADNVHQNTINMLKNWASKHTPNANKSTITSLTVQTDALNHVGYHEPTVAQLTLFLIWLTAILVWAFRLLRKKTTKSKEDVEVDPEAQSNGPIKLPHNGVDTNSKENALDGKVLEKIAQDIENAGKDDNVVNKEKDEKEPTQNSTTTAEKPEKDATKSTDVKKETKTFTTFKPPPSFDHFLYHVIIFGGFMLYFHLCDYQHIFRAGERIYSRDLFIFLILLLFLVTTGFTLKATPDRLINRDQTEEWRGWMQVMFVWYHYFAAKETYNYIRIFIACYVWMTGFGNFSFFWIRKDFSVWRMIKMLWRLNFLVIVVCIATGNEYMLYYICAMHTYWFFTVYIFMRVLNSWNTDPKKMAVKFAAYFIINLIIFDIPGVGNIVFRPFYFVLGYQGSLHEWMFRAGLDHYATIIGMFCAYHYPNYEKLMKWLERKDDPNHYKLGLVVKFIIGIVLSIAVVIWHQSVMWKEKYSYNHVHPYTSFIPILAFLYFRNLFPVLRSHYLHLLAWLGKITLETYISQLHVYMQSGAKELIVYIPNYPLLNFALATAIYLFIAYWLFNITSEFSAYLLPQDMKKIGIHVAIAIVLFGVYAVFAVLLKTTHIV